jgi:hypothetical protein
MDTLEFEQRETLTRDEAATHPVSSHFPAHTAGFCELIG